MKVIKCNNELLEFCDCIELPDLLLSQSLNVVPIVRTFSYMGRDIAKQGVKPHYTKVNYGMGLDNEVSMLN